MSAKVSFIYVIHKFYCAILIAKENNKEKVAPPGLEPGSTV